MILRSFNYKIEYRPSQQMGAADMLSRLSSTTEIEETVHALLPMVGNIALNAEIIAEETKKDEVLQEVTRLTRMGWPEKMDPTNKAYPFFKIRMSLSIEEGCVLVGERVVIPPTLRENVLNLLHGGHPGVVRMKMRARGSVYWPKIDEDIGEFVKNCDPCAQYNFKAVSPATGRWPITTAPWMRLHLDFFYFKTITVLILVDSFSKWLDVWPVASTAAEHVIPKLRLAFSYFGLPVQIVTDNGPPFTSIDFLDFCASNGILASKSPPYHPQSNGQAEIVVKITKTILKKMSMANPSEDLSTRIMNMLMNYRSTPSTVTGLTPTQVMLTFEPRHKLALLLPRQNVDKTYVPITKVFLPGERVKVLMKKGDLARVGKIIRQLGAYIYIVDLDGEATLCHINQLATSVPDEKTEDKTEKIPEEKKTEEGPVKSRELEKKIPEDPKLEEPRRSKRESKGLPKPRLNLKIQEESS
ncbi:hypothetical protein KUF71_009326 [Frankliniella fusca]|uniref:RNA-directed DNA polymerase n=1 Tax=Frankliniella fusca TaxID=407009 RepID=A0AAE1HEU2_9NEOP|nr:hypothetical protein KUF71_009326 [Frankliniella fusca]